MQLCSILTVLILHSKPAVKLQNGRESHLLHPLYLTLFYNDHSSLFCFFFSFYLIFLSYFYFPSFAFYFLFSFFLQSMTLFYHLLWNSVHIHPSEKLQRTNQKGVQWGIQLLSSPRKTNSSALWNCFHCSEAKSYGFCLLILVPCKEMSSGVTSRRQPTPWNSRCQFFIPSLIILWVLDTKGS